MDQGSSTRARALTLAAGMTVGGLVLAAPAGAATTKCTADGQIPNGGLACLTVDTVDGHVDQVKRLSSTITYKGYYNFQVRISEPGSGESALTPRYVSAMDLPNFPRDPNATTTYPFTYCGSFAGGSAGMSNGCGTYKQGSKVWLEVYSDSVTATYRTPAIDVNPSPVTPPVCTWKC